MEAAADGAPPATPPTPTAADARADRHVLPIGLGPGELVLLLSMASGADTLLLRVVAPEEVAAGQPVPVTLRVENVSGRDLELELRGRTIAFDLVAFDNTGSEVWRRLHDASIPGILRLERLEAGATLELTATWDQRSNTGDPVPAGSYALRGELLTAPEPLVTPVRRLRILPPGPT